MKLVNLIACQCGQSALEVSGAHILCAECLCNSCREAGAILQNLPGSPLILDHKGATSFVLVRKDRIRLLRGAENLKEFRLNEDSSTRRVIATCCNSPMFLEFTKGHWLSIYAGRWPAETLPPLELRTMTGDLPKGHVLPDDVKNAKTHTLKFFAQLLKAWTAMGFRAPKINFVNGKITP